MLLAALGGRHAEAVSLTEAAVAQAEVGGQGAAAPYADWVTAILHNGLGRYADALTAAPASWPNALVSGSSAGRH